MHSQAPDVFRWRLRVDRLSIRWREAPPCAAAQTGAALRPIGRVLQTRGCAPTVSPFVAVVRGVLVFAAIGLSACGREQPVQEKASGPRLIFRDAAGRELTTDDIEVASGTVRWEVVGAGSIPAEASRLHTQAREAGERGDLPQALSLLAQARRLAPDWAYPVYDTAFTYLLQGDSAKAEALYAEVDRMEPRGFFTAKTSLDCLRRERTGVLFPGFCKAFASLESMDDKAKATLLEGIVEKYPSFPPAWKELSTLRADEDPRLQAITRGLEHEPDPETKGVLLINRALILHRRGDHNGAIQILGELALDPGSTLSTEMLAKATLAEVVS